MADTSFQERIHRINTGTQWIPAGVVMPRRPRSVLRKVWRMADTFIQYLRGPLMLTTGFLLGTLVASHWANISLQMLGY